MEQRNEHDYFREEQFEINANVQMDINSIKSGMSSMNQGIEEIRRTMKIKRKGTFTRGFLSKSSTTNLQAKRLFSSKSQNISSAFRSKWSTIQLCRVHLAHERMKPQANKLMSDIISVWRHISC